MANILRTVIQFRRDLAENWLLHKDVVPAAGEPCFEVDTGVFKIGDGKTTYEHLKPIGGVEFKIDADGKSIVLEDDVFKLMGFDAAEVGAQPRKGENGLEWVVPSTEIVEELQSAVSDLQSDIADLDTAVSNLQKIVGATGEESSPLLTRVETLETKMDGVDAQIDAKIKAFAEDLTEDGKVNTLMELINYVESHGKEVADMASDIVGLKELVGLTSVKDQIDEAINASGHMAEKKANAVFEHVKYEISHAPEGTLVDYRDKEIRVMVPAGTQWVKQNVGGTGNANMYYMGFKAYAPEGAVSFKEGDRGVIIDEMFTFDDDFAGIDEFGRKYSICWLALASYDAASNTWTYFGKNSSTKKYIGWDYVVEWYDVNGVKIGSDCVRINLSNEECHNKIEPYYMASFVKEVAVGNTLLDVVEGKVTIPVGAGLQSSDEIVVNQDGTLSVGTISFSKIAQSDDEYITLDGGGAAV